MNKEKQKKNQHIIPACYLQNFIATDPPEKYRNIKDFEIGVYINEKEVSIWKMKGIRQTTFTSKYYYDMDTENYIDNDQIVENYFTEFEGQYNVVLNKIINRNEINENDYHNFIHFIYLLMARNKKTQDVFEKNILLMDKHFNISSKINDFSEKALARGSIINTSITEKIKELGFKLIENKTLLPFITADCPYAVTYSMVNGKEVPEFYFPLTPKYALITNSIKADSIYAEINDIEMIKYFNNNIFNSSYNYIISNIEYPFNMLTIIEPKNYNNKGTIKTSNDIYPIDIEKIEWVEKCLIFKIKNKGVIENLIGKDLIELKYISNNGGCSMLRSIKMIEHSVTNLTFKLADKSGIGLHKRLVE